MPVELLADSLAPLFAQVPQPARVADVSTLERNLKAKGKSRGETRNYPAGLPMVVKLSGLTSDGGKG